MLRGFEKRYGDALRDRIRQALWLDESECLEQRLQQARLTTRHEQRIQEDARRLAGVARQLLHEQTGPEAFLNEYDLSSQEGVLLMCIAEALLRIPDAGTADRLIRDRVSRGRWDEHLGSSDSLLVNASSWGLLLTGRWLAAADTAPELLLERLVARVGGSIVRAAMQQAMRLLAHQFVLGRDMPEALARAAGDTGRARYSFDCLGEAAHTAQEVERYFDAYREAIREIGKASHTGVDLYERPGISIKLSALHPRYEYAQRERVYHELLPRLKALVEAAAAAGIGVTLDAEEAERLELSLDIFEQLSTDLGGNDWHGLGLAVQAYQKRALPVLQWLLRLAKRQRRMIPVRLVKGAYWDTEIKRAQQGGLAAYPVFTRKAATDVSYLACARFLLQHADRMYAQFATHNALTLAWLMVLGEGKRFEFQRLHGMGVALYRALDECYSDPPAVRVYAPVGSHRELLPYLLRRLLENGANSSFVNQLGNEQTALEVLVENPCQHIEDTHCRPHPRIPLPSAMYGKSRRNSNGWDLSDPDTVATLGDSLQKYVGTVWRATAIVCGREHGEREETVRNPAQLSEQAGVVLEAGSSAVEQALSAAAAAAVSWNNQGAAQRADCLRRTADLFEAHSVALLARVVREGGRSVPDALDEVREAVDFCRYYAWRAEAEFQHPQVLPGPSGEHNELQLQGRGVFVCISPWNFPLAIFTGQVAAALAAGNAVLAKPARQTPLTAALVVSLMHQAGVPVEVLHLLPGSGRAIGRQLCADLRLAGVAFTGSTETARQIQGALAQRDGPIVPLIAETGGQNVMIADSSALPEQLVMDVLQSAFNSAGQRCSALRVLFVQTDIADRVIALLRGAMEELRMGNPLFLDTDVGPLIDASAVSTLQSHAERMRREARLIHKMHLPPALSAGSFFPPQVYELTSLALLEREVFGPVLHLIRYQGSHLDQVIDAVNATGYGLTLGVHSRIEATWQRVSERARFGNLYINRNMIGAVVGVQPFGGEGLSGTGPKAGGPYYLHHFATERTRSVNTAALGGDTGLLSLSDD